jgi:hypothetical protein
LLQRPLRAASVSLFAVPILIGDSEQLSRAWIFMSLILISDHKNPYIF